jgi:hypothetical protein
LRGSGGEKDAATKEIEVGSAVYLPFHHLELGNLAFGLSIAPRQREGCANSGAILLQTGREGFDRAHSAAACFGKLVIQGNAGGAPLRRLRDAGITDQVGVAAR